jgi:hypothetical protein
LPGGPEETPPDVFLGLPHSGGMAPESMFSLGIASLGKYTVRLEAVGSSLLAYNFNRLWAEALNLNPRPRYFAMHHSDIAAPAGWLDVLIDELENEHADLVSAVVPIKDFQGLTSTAVIDLERDARRRLTVTEAMSLPLTFDAKIAGAKLGANQPVLLVNTGLWVCRFAGQPWVEEHYFHTGDATRRTPEGWKAHVFPEDWLFSAELAARKLKVLATRKVPVMHYGRAPFGIGGEQLPWGTLESDQWGAV